MKTGKYVPLAVVLGLALIGTGGCRPAKKTQVGIEEPKQENIAAKAEVPPADGSATGGNEPVISDPSQLQIPQKRAASGSKPATSASPSQPRPRIQKNTATIKGLFVSTLDNGKMVGFASDIIAARSASGAGTRSSHQYSACRFTRPVGGEMQVSLQEAYRTFQSRQSNASGHGVQISFGDKYSPKDGGSGGAVFTVLLTALENGWDIDPKVAMTGDVTVNGKIKAIGATPQKIWGAHMGKCRIVAIPQTNARDVVDLAYLYTNKCFWYVQIFTMKTVDDAVNIARRNRSANLSTAIREFRDVQTYVHKHPNGHYKNKKVQARLREILKLAPNHLSARLMLMEATGKLPRFLTIEGSLTRISDTASPYMHLIFSSGQNRRSPVSFSDLKPVNDALRKDYRITHPKTHPLIGALLEFGKVAQDIDCLAYKLDCSSKKSRRSRKSLAKERREVGLVASDAKAKTNAVVEEIRKLQNDPKGLLRSHRH